MVEKFYFKLTGHGGAIDSESRTCKSHADAKSQGVRWATLVLRRRHAPDGEASWGYYVSVSTSTGQIALESVSA